MAVNVFSVPVFFIVFRETLETVIIVSVLLAFLKQTLGGELRDDKVYLRLRRQIWVGTGLGCLICLVIGAGLIGAFYKLGSNHWTGTEYYWEGSFALVASIIITVVGAALLRISKMQEKWRVKLSTTLEVKLISTRFHTEFLKHWLEKYIMFLLPFVTVLREGIEAVVFIAGVSFSAPAASIPLPVVVGLAAGCVVGYIIYRGGTGAKLQYFLVGSTCLLYLVAAGLFSKAVWYFEAQNWNSRVGGDAAETGAGAGSYDIRKSVWHVNYGSPSVEGGGGWGVFNGILGWQNSATYGSVISYNLYWLSIICGFYLLRFQEVHGHWPLLKANKKRENNSVIAQTVIRETGVVSGTRDSMEK